MLRTPGVLLIPGNQTKKLIDGGIPTLKIKLLSMLIFFYWAIPVHNQKVYMLHIAGYYHQFDIMIKVM